MKFTCFIDACSYIYLTQMDKYVNGKTLLDLLDKNVHVKYSNEVYREIARHQNENMPNALKRSSKVYKLNKKRKAIKTYVEYEKRLFDTSSQAGDKDRGEKHNLAALIDHYTHESSKSLIYLTDDKKAIRNTINEALHCFPVYQIWTSFDVILFLFLEDRSFIKEFAESAIRDINSFLAKNMSEGTREEITEERLQNFRLYMDRLNRIHKLRK